MVTRVRIDAEGQSREEVETHLNAAFQLLFQNSVSTSYTFVGSGFVSYPFGPIQVVPRESEFIEEVYESAVHEETGAISWKGRRVIRFFGGPEENHWEALSQIRPEALKDLARVEEPPSSITVDGRTYVPMVQDALEPIIGEKAHLGEQMNPHGDNDVTVFGDDLDTPQNT